MFRVYDKEKHTLVNESICLSGYGDMYLCKKNMFGKETMRLVPNRNYVIQKDIGLHDNNGCLIFEGDICQINSLNVVGVVAYEPSRAAYYLFDYENSTYYFLNLDRCNNDITIIGNVIENPDLINEYKSEVDHDDK